MTSRSDIQSGRLVYTCNCGWLDLGHANNANPAPQIGAANLWKQIVDEKYKTKDTINGKPCFAVYYKQQMSKRGITASAEGAYLIRSGLSLAKKESIALAIFLEVSHGFENLQDSIPFKWVTDSGFSLEDLISNVVGFYMAVKGMTLSQVKMLCKEVSEKEALNIYDKYLPDGIGAEKNYSHQMPKYFACDECITQPNFPAILQSIPPAKFGTGDMIRYSPADSQTGSIIGFRKPRNFDNSGRLVGP